MGDRLATIDMARKVGGASVPISVWELGPHLTQCHLGRGLSPSSGILIHPTVWPQTGQTGQRSDSIGQTVLQMVAKKSHEKIYLHDNR